MTGESVNKITLYRLILPGLLRAEVVGLQLVVYLRITEPLRLDRSAEIMDSSL